MERECGMSSGSISEDDCRSAGERRRGSFEKFEFEFISSELSHGSEGESDSGDRGATVSVLGTAANCCRVFAARMHSSTVRRVVAATS